MKKRILLLLLFIFPFFCFDNVKAKETEILSSEELSKLERIETTTVSYVNPLYRDVITTNDLVVGSEPKLYTLYNGKEYHTTIESAAIDLRQGMKNRNETIIIRIKSKENYSTVINEILEKTLEHTGVSTEGDYLKWQYGGFKAQGSALADEEYNYYEITYTLTYYTTKEQEAELTNAIKNLTNSLNLTGTQYNKLNKIYTYITNNITYDQEHLNEPDYTLQYTAYAALVNKTAVCQGYAVLLYRLALENGIDARLIAGYSNMGSHGWNIVKLGKYYYNVDATWDASYAQDNLQPYYLKNNDNFQDHTRSNEYNTDEFNKKYPMSKYDYSDQTDKEIDVKYNSLTRKWEYTADGEADYTYSGIAKNANGTWYIKNGIVDFSYSGTYKDSKGETYIIKNGEVQTKLTEVMMIEGKWRMVEQGKVNYKYTGIGKNGNGTWYLENGLITFKTNGLVLYQNKWYLLENSQFKNTYTGLSTNSIGTWYVKNGIIDFSYTGTYKDLKGETYIIKNGEMQKKLTEVMMIEGKWRMVEQGKVNYKYTGIGKNGNGNWYLENGLITFKTNGLVLYKNKWYLLENSKLKDTYTGLSTNANGMWYVKNGIIDFSYTGTYKDSKGVIYTIKNGKVVAA